MSLLFPLAVVLGVLYGLLFLQRPRNLARAVAKTGAIALLSLAALAADLPVLLVAALALSALGDWFLAFEGERNFLGGLVSFLLAHLCYAALFTGGQDAVFSAGLPFFAGTIVIFAFALGVLRKLRPHLGKMRLPVTVYTGVLCAMAVAALSRGPDVLLLPGVVLLLVSDAVLAFERFVFDRRAPQRSWSSPVVWFSYLAGQALVTASFMYAGQL